MIRPVDEILEPEEVSSPRGAPSPGEASPLDPDFGSSSATGIALRRLRGENAPAGASGLPSLHPPDLDFAPPPAQDWLREDPLAGYYGRLQADGRRRLDAVPARSRRGWVLGALGVSLLGWCIATTPGEHGRGDAAAGVHAVLHSAGTLARDGGAESEGYRRGAEQAWFRLLQAADQQVSDPEARLGVAQESLEVALGSGDPAKIVAVTQALQAVPGGARDRRVRLLLAEAYRGLARTSSRPAERTRWESRAAEAAASAELLDPTLRGEGWRRATAGELYEAIRVARVRSGGSSEAERRGYTAALDAAAATLSTVSAVARDAAPTDPAISP